METQNPPEKMRLYIAGPMTGVEDFNFPLFRSTAARLRSLGHEVIDPSENADGEQHHPWEFYLGLGVQQVCQADALALLPGWQRSRGARLEVHVAQALGKRLLIAETLQPWHESVTREAERIVNGPRRDEYGHPRENFAKTALFWSVISGAPITPRMVGQMLISMKLARDSHKPGRDNLVDIAGYAACLEKLDEA